MTSPFPDPHSKTIPLAASPAGAGLILASVSPRRRYLLEQAGLTFSVVAPAVDEESLPLAPPDDYVRRLALAKAGEVADRHPDHWVIGADTVVSIGSDLMGKPADDARALAMLRRLSGRVHQVYTGFALVHRGLGREIVDAVRTDVTFKTLDETEIDWYIRTGEPFDKAGAYAIQGIGTFLVRSIHGSYTNVVGLPVCEVIELLIREGILGALRRAPHPSAAPSSGETSGT